MNTYIWIGLIVFALWLGSKLRNISKPEVNTSTLKTVFWTALICLFIGFILPKINWKTNNNAVGFSDNKNRIEFKTEIKEPDYNVYSTSTSGTVNDIKFQETESGFKMTLIEHGTAQDYCYSCSNGLKEKWITILKKKYDKDKNKMDIFIKNDQCRLVEQSAKYEVSR